MDGYVGEFITRLGNRETRLFFPEWPLGEGKKAVGVTVYPHLCGTCVGGNHTHIDIDQTPLKICNGDAGPVVRLTEAQVEVITGYIKAMMQVDGLTHDLHHALE